MGSLHHGEPSPREGAVARGNLGRIPSDFFTYPPLGPSFLLRCSWWWVPGGAATYGGVGMGALWERGGDQSGASVALMPFETEKTIPLSTPQKNPVPLLHPRSLCLVSLSLSLSL